MHLTHTEFFAFIAQLEFHMLHTMSDLGKASVAAQERGDEVDAIAKASIVVAFDELRHCMALAFRDTLGVHFAGSSNGRTPDFESGNGGSNPPPAAKLH